MHRSRLVSIMQAASGCRLSWKYFIEEPDNPEYADELARIDEETELDKDSVHTTDNTIDQTELNEGMGCLQSYLCAAVVENALMGMHMIEHTKTSMKLKKVIMDMNLKRKKYGVLLSTADEDEFAQMDSENVGEWYTIRKSGEDRIYVTELIKSLYVELSLSKSFRCLTNSIEEMLARDKYLVRLKDDEWNKKIRAKELFKQIRQLRSRLKIDSYEKDMIMYKLQMKLKDSKLLSEISDRYVSNWQDARSEQHNQVLSTAANKQCDVVEGLKQKYNFEYRAHFELEAYTNIIIQDTHDKIEEQIEKYEKDTQAMDLKIQIKKNEYLNMYKERIRMEEMMKEHEKSIKKWIQFKEGREKFNMYRENMHKSACIVQAWWRGLLVRRKIGPYRVKTLKLRR